MSIRIALLTVVVIGLAIYAWRDWFVSLCGLILLMAVIEHPDMPKTIGGIQGANPWNILLAIVVLAWLVARRREGLQWDMPRSVSILLLLYLGVVLVGFARMWGARDQMASYTTGQIISEYLVNTVKWVIPGLLMFDGCRTRRRLLIGLACVLAVYVGLAVQVIRWMPPRSAISGQSLTARSRKIILNEVGYHAINMSMMLSGASWAILATLPLVRNRKHVALIILVSLAVAYGQALTAGRMGYVTWGVVGVCLCTIRWRKYLLLLPLVPLLVVLVVPGAMDRMMEGFGEQDLTGEAVADDYQITSGRTLIWPYVIDGILASPVIGYGRNAMILTGLSAELLTKYNESFPHPHNAYLEMLLDNGLIGFLLVMPFYGLVTVWSVQLFRDSRSPMFVAIGGATCALVFALLVAAMGSQTFYPREGAVGMWAAMGLMLRVWVGRAQVLGAAQRSMSASVHPAMGAPPQTTSTR